MEGSFQQGEARQFYKEDPFAQTTYSAYFKSGTSKTQGEAAKASFSSSKAAVKDEDGIHWAGGLHSRQDFNKKRPYR